MCTRAILFFASCLLGACGAKEMKVSRLDPGFGGTKGDDDVRIIGQGFRTDIGYSVYFGPRKASSVIVEGDDTLVATTPSFDEARSVDIRIVADDGHVFLLKNAFRFVDQAGWRPGEALDRVEGEGNTEKLRRHQ
jgi:IPT/TIG domain-containing protein